MDVRVLIPRTRRAIDGPTASGSGAVSTTLNDDQVKNLVSDAIAEVIWYVPAWGKKLVATHTDPAYGAPDEWDIEPDPSEPEQTMVVAQAALDYFWQTTKNLKVSETIQNEAAIWTYQLSANLLVEQFKLLKETRDTALDRVFANQPALEQFHSFIAVRDSQVAALIEPWSNSEPGSGIVGQMVYPQTDFRFEGF